MSKDRSTVHILIYIMQLLMYNSNSIVYRYSNALSVTFVTYKGCYSCSYTSLTHNTHTIISLIHYNNNKKRKQEHHLIVKSILHIKISELLSANRHCLQFSFYCILL